MINLVEEKEEKKKKAIGQTIAYIKEHRSEAGLSGREGLILTKMTKGKTSQQIADELGIQKSTVDSKIYDRIDKKFEKAYYSVKIDKMIPGGLKKLLGGEYF